MENNEKKHPETNIIPNPDIIDKENDGSKNTGSSKVDTRINQPKRDYGRTTDTIGVGHEPGTIPGIGA